MASGIEKSKIYGVSLFICSTVFITQNAITTLPVSKRYTLLFTSFFPFLPLFLFSSFYQILCSSFSYSFFFPLLYFSLISSLFIHMNCLCFFYDSTGLFVLLSILLIKLFSNAVFNRFCILPLDLFRKYIFSLSLSHPFHSASIFGFRLSFSFFIVNPYLHLSLSCFLISSSIHSFSLTFFSLLSSSL